MPRVSPDGLGQYDTRSAVQKAQAAANAKAAAAKAKKIAASYAASSANTTKYYAPAKKKAAPKAAPKSAASRSSAPASSGLLFSDPSGFPGGGPGAVPASLASLSAANYLPAMPNDAQLRKQASDAVALELDPEIHANQFAYNQENLAYGNTVNQLMKQLGLSKGDIQNLYSALDVNLQAQGQKSKAAYDTAKASTAATYHQANTATDQNFDTAAAQLSAELGRLGIQASPDSSAKLLADKSFISGLNASKQASQSGFLDAMSGAAAGENANLRGAAASTSPMLQARLQTAADQQKAQLSAAHNQSLAKLKFQIAELSNSRQGKIAQTLKALQDQAYQRQQDALQQAFSNQLALGQLGISQGQLDVARTNATTTAKSAAQTAAQRAADAAAKSGAPQTGLERAFQYLTQNYKVAGGVPINKLQDALIDVINGNSNDPGYGSGALGSPGNIPGYNAQYLDQYLRDLNQVAEPGKQGWSPAEVSVLRNAILRFFGK